MGKFNNHVYGNHFPRDGEIPPKMQVKIEKIVNLFKVLNPDGDGEQIKELMCILYRRQLIDLR